MVTKNGTSWSQDPYLRTRTMHEIHEAGHSVALYLAGYESHGAKVFADGMESAAYGPECTGFKAVLIMLCGSAAVASIEPSLHVSPAKSYADELAANRTDGDFVRAMTRLKALRAEKPVLRKCAAPEPHFLTRAVDYLAKDLFSFEPVRLAVQDLAAKLRAPDNKFRREVNGLNVQWACEKRHLDALRGSSELLVVIANMGRLLFGKQTKGMVFAPRVVASKKSAEKRTIISHCNKASAYCDQAHTHSEMPDSHKPMIKVAQKNLKAVADSLTTSDPGEREKVWLTVAGDNIAAAKAAPSLHAEPAGHLRDAADHVDRAIKSVQQQILGQTS